MNSWWCRILYFMFLSAFLYGCSGGGGLAVRSEPQSQAATLLEKGIRAQKKGEFRQAEQYLSDSLRISSSIEDDTARINAMVNLARLHRLNHKPESAALNIDQALKLSNGLSGSLMVEVAYEKALIELVQKHYEESLNWAAKSLAADNGESRGRILNLLARIQRAKENKNDAASYAIKAREENRKYGHLDEEANSLRMLGSLERENKRFGEAGKLLSESLEIDKKTGESHKIALDLEEMAALAGDQGDINMMIDYLERAFIVHINGGRMEIAASIKQKIAETYNMAGDKTQAEKAFKAAEQLRQNKPKNGSSRTTEQLSN